MFEQANNDHVLCGIIKENGEYSPIYCDPANGECYFADPVMSYNRLISELSVDRPFEVELADIAEAHASGAYGECIGVIYEGDTIIKLLDDVSAVRVPVDLPMSVAGDIFAIDIYGDYDEE